MKYNILIVEDEKNQSLIISKSLIENGFNTIIAGNMTEALKVLAGERIDLVLTDFKLPDGNGLDVINEIKKINPEIFFVVMTAFGDVETSVKCLKSGASDFLTKPIDLCELEKIIFKLLKNKMLVEEVNQLRRDIESLYSAENICGTNEKLTSQIARALKVASVDSNVLIYGESGTGKELFANLIHYNSDRKNKSFVKVNCSAIPAELIESELFGHDKGSFTGAYYDKIGKFESADGGTIFVDEIGELPLNMQVKLLRVIQEREIEPVGSNSARKINVRFLFATNRDLSLAVKERQFREDLYYRINTISINLPALRERKSDIPLLAKYFIKKYNKSLKRNVSEISSDALDSLIKYSWPGNIRELQNIIENTMVLLNEHDEIIYVRNLPENIIRRHPDGEADRPVKDNSSAEAVENTIREHIEKVYSEHGRIDIGAFFDKNEKKILEWALKKMNGTKTEIAKFFCIDEKTVRYKLKKYDL